VLPSASVSSHHATIKRKGDDFFVQDLGTTNGTRLNGAEVEEARLADGDHVTFGDIASVIYMGKAPTAKTTNVPPQPPVSVNSPAPSAASSMPRAVRAVPRRTSRPVTQYKESTGCAGFFMLLVFITFAFVIGLSLRHYNETKGFLPADVFSKLRGKGESDASPVREELKKQDKPKAPEKATAPTAPAAEPKSMDDGSMKMDK
jgi:pSer/pThr/pTyr-binding forkhead associated (FHA) protein